MKAPQRVRDTSFHTVILVSVKMADCQSVAMRKRKKIWISKVKRRCLPIAESRLFPCIHYHQCRVSVIGVGCERLITALCFRVDSATWNRQLFFSLASGYCNAKSAALVERAPSLSPSPTLAHSRVSNSRANVAEKLSWDRGCQIGHIHH